MEVLSALPFVAFMGEKLSERLVKPIIKIISTQVDVPQGLADWVEAVVCAVPGGAISYLAGLDLFAAVGLPLADNAGPIVTAVLVGFGSNLIHDIIGGLSSE